MNVNGVDVSSLSHVKVAKVIPIVPGRVAHIDGDFLAYMVAYDDSKSIEDMRHNCDKLAEKLRLMSGSEHVTIHLTPKESNKGGRYETALLREYQGARKGKPKPKYLHLIRAHMADTMNGIQHVTCEADDGMAMAQYAAIAKGERNLSIIITKDKDLCMVPGLQLDWDTGEITDTTDDFGDIRLADDKVAKKIRGRGWKMFWAQMLTGDTADNISGLPMCCDLQYLPRGKYKNCGPVLAYEILKPLKTNKEAFETVRGLFNAYHEASCVKDSDVKPLVNWRDGTPLTAGQALISEAKLLWMRRKDDPDDVIQWLKETCL